MCGSIKMVYALVYTLFLGFGLQFGSDLFLLFDQSARHELDTLAARAAATITVTGTYIADANATLPQKLARAGSFTFTPSTPIIRQNIVQGCYRSASFPWYLQPYPWWSQFIIVPVFSVLSSLNNEQPLTWDLVVMVVISCAAYAANKVAVHFIFNRSDVVSAIGAFVVGFLGNVYSRKMGGTAFTSMVTGVLFLVPVSVPRSRWDAARVGSCIAPPRPVWSVRGWWNYRAEQRHPDRHRHGHSYHRYHRRSLHLSGTRVSVW